MDKRQAKKNEKKQQEMIQKKSTGEKAVTSEEKKPEQPTNAKKNEPENKQEQTTVYAISAITYTLISAAVVVLSMIVWIKPGYYFLESLIGKTVDIYVLDFAYEQSFSNLLPSYVNILFIIIGIVCILNTLLSVFMVSKTMKAVNKPYPLVSVVCLLLTAAAVVLFVVARAAMKDAFVDSKMETIYEVQKSFGIYYGIMLGIAVNAVAAFVHMIMTIMNASIWKKTGKVR